MSARRLALYREADDAVAGFAAATGLRCPSGCGACCANSTPTVAPAEAEAIAAELIARGSAVAVLASARLAGERRCALYDGDDRLGRCTVYELRPVMCRLYGFAAVRRNGQADLAVCRVHAQTIPDEVGVAVAHVDSGAAVPMIPDWAARSAALPHRGGDTDAMLLMNDALVAALDAALTAR